MNDGKVLFCAGLFHVQGLFGRFSSLACWGELGACLAG